MRWKRWSMPHIHMIPLALCYINRSKEEMNKNIISYQNNNHGQITILSSLSPITKLMDSSTARVNVSGRAQIVSKECDNIFPAKKSASSRRTPSFSSLSSSSLSSCSSSLGSLHFPDDSPLSPATPLRFSGVPFSWEHLPGIPKKNVQKKKAETLLKQKQLLPLPPPTSTPPSSRKYNVEEFGTSRKFSAESFRKDPFIAALVECSKDDHHGNDDDDREESSSRSSFFNGAKVTRSISDRFGFVSLYTSCKKTCTVSESIVYLPRSSRKSYDLIHRRSR